MSNYKLDLWKMLEPMINEYLKTNGERLLNLTQRFSPVKSGTFLHWNQLWEVEKVGKWYQIKVFNDVDYAEKVELWWRKTAVNWHLHNWEVFRNKGATTYSRAILELKKQLYK